MRIFILSILILVILPTFIIANNVLYSVTSISSQNPVVVANNDFISMYENSVWYVPVLSNDYGLTEGHKAPTITRQPKFGKAQVMPDHTIKYTPNLYFIGYDDFEYRVCNNYNSCDNGIVTIEVLNYDYKPRAINDTVRVYNEKNITVDVLKNDLELMDPPITLTIITELKNGYSELVEDPIDYRTKIKPHFETFFLGMDSLQYQVCDADGDCSQAWVFLIMSNDQSSKIKIPSGFSPNGDGINDTFFIREFQHYTDIYIRIMDRNGVLVYEAKPYNNNWDGYGNKGTYSGKLVPAGTYYYVIKLKGLKNDLTGFIYLNR